MECSNCGNTEGYYKYQEVKGKIFNVYDGDGKYAEDQRDSHEGIMYGVEEKTAYCLTCNKKLTKKELEKQI
jgi:hypothetical protein